MPKRPESDRELDAQTVLAALRHQFPELGCEEARLLGSGWATDVFVVDQRYAVRFPRNAELAGHLDRDVAVLDLVSSRLGPFVPVPTVLHRGRAGPHFPYDFLVCGLVPGISADDPSAPTCPDLPADLGRALTYVHSIPVAAAREAGLGPPGWDDYAGTPSFLHLDFRGDNILVDPRSGRLTGVVDWGNAAIGDPALDFMWLVVWRGWGFAETVLRGYGLPLDSDFAARVRRKAEAQRLLSNRELPPRGQR